jgi:hypothetical protein
VSGATPASRTTKTFAFIIHIPAVVPAAGVVLDVPTVPTTSGPFTASSKKVVARLAKSEALTIAVGAKAVKLHLNCLTFPAGSIPASAMAAGTATKEPPLSTAIDPVIAMSA